MKTIYEPHPVTPERKAELKAQGYKILDARFAPQDAQETPKTTRKRRAKKDADIAV